MSFWTRSPISLKGTLSNNGSHKAPPFNPSMAPTLHTINPSQIPPFLPPTSQQQGALIHTEQKSQVASMPSSLPSPFSMQQVIYTTFVCISLLFLTHCHQHSNNDIQDLLRSQGLPAGLFPKNVKSYELDADGHLQVHLDQPCMAKFETRVFFDSVVRANLSYGGLIGVEGLSQEELFLWLPVKGIIVYNPSSGLILFDIGVAHKQFSLALFEEPPVCHPQGVSLEETGRKEMGFEVER